MAVSLLGSQLIEANRLGQIAISERALEQLKVIWLLLDLEDLDGTREAYLNAAMAVLLEGRANSEALAAGFLQSFYTAEAAYVPQIITPGLTEADIAAARTSLEVMGPVHVKRSMLAGQTLEYASQTALQGVLGAANRHVLDGGRQPVIETALADPGTSGWQRITKVGACAFCRLLAGRGSVYRTEESSKFASHDACRCSVAPAFGGPEITVKQYEASKRVRSVRDRQNLNQALANLDDKPYKPRGEVGTKYLLETRRRLIEAAARNKNYAGKAAKHPGTTRRIKEIEEDLRKRGVSF
jgi:hypothetical protein